MIDLTVVFRSLKGRCAENGNKVWGRRPNCPRLTTCSFITLAFQKGEEYRNADLKRLNGDDLSTLGIEIW